MDKEQVEQIIKDYIKENLSVHIEEKNNWMGDCEKYFEIKVCLSNETIYTSTT